MNTAAAKWDNAEAISKEWKKASAELSKVFESVDNFELEEVSDEHYVC
jgi:hypothetical protein